MNTEALSQDLLVRAVKATGLKYVIDSDDDMRISYKGRTSFGDYNVYFSIQGNMKEILRGFAFFENAIPKQKIPEIVYMCNRYHNKHSMPNLYVRNPSSEGSSANLMSQVLFDLEKGVNIEQIQNFISSYIGAHAAFEKWAMDDNVSLT